jgi:oxygen-dependent protoporphyrinogen oxidase
VLYTAPLHQLPAINIESAIDLKPLADVYYPPLSILVLGFRREDVRHPLDGFGMLIPEAERFRIFGTLFSSTIFNHRTHEGHVMLTNYIGGARNSELAMASTEALLEVTMQDLRATLGVTGQPTYVKHVLLKKSVPQYNLGYGQLKELMDRIETQHTGFFMAGNYRRGVPVRDVISSGYEAAENIVQALDCT